MKAKFKPRLWVPVLLLLLLGFSGNVLAKPEAEACIERGALAYDNWTKTDAGGSGMPAGETFSDYLRCKSCHGWDRLGMDGGYVRRSRTAERPNAGLGDGDTTSRNIAPGLGNFYHIQPEDVLHAGTGRALMAATRPAVLLLICKETASTASSFIKPAGVFPTPS